MNAGFKRNVKYISLMQLKFLGWLFLFGCVYGVVMGFTSGGGVEEMKQTGGQYFVMLLLIMPMTLQLRYVKNIAGFVLSMGCTRKNIIIGQHILSLEILMESAVLITGIRMLLKMGQGWDAAYFCYYTAGVVAMLAAGIFGGFALSKGTTAGAILYIVFMCITIGAITGSVFLASGIVGNSEASWIMEWNNPAQLAVMQLSAIALYGIASAFVAGKFKKMEVVC